MVKLSKEKPDWLGNGEHWRARMGEIIDMLRALGKRRKEEVNVSYEQGDAGKIAKLDAVVRIGERPAIAVVVRERDDWKQNGRRVGMRMLAAGGAKSIGYYLVALSGAAILYTRSQLEEFIAGRCKIDAVRLDDVIEKLEYELFGVPAENISTAQAENYLKSSLKDCKNLSEETRKAIEKVKIKKSRKQ